MSIITANTWFEQHPTKPVNIWPAFYRLFILPYCARNGLQMQHTVNDLEPLKAFVHQGRWIALCPDSLCSGAERTWEEGFFFCFSCMNAHVRHTLFRVTFPSNRQAIEAILEYRSVLNRNWLLSEDIQDLIDENIVNDLPEPPKSRLASVEGGV